ncbi:MAG: MarR family transcriptional regulator [Ardenticatenaceae bacterium]|nr:MarR family transcriptional regulator [Ardenticatenaceae bacterium]
MKHFVFDESLGFIINRTAMRLKRELQHAFKAHGHQITPEQWALLNRLWEREGLSQVELAELTFKDKPNVTRMLEVLERRGLVIRERDEHDRRVYKVFLTAEGRALKQQLIPLAAEVLDQAYQGLTAADIEQIGKVLNIVHDNLG